MTSLRSLQHQFAQYLMGTDDTAVKLIVGDEKADAAERMNLYADSYVARLQEALETDYPGVWALLGDEEFPRMVRSYIQTHPSRYPSIRWFGQHLEDFLAATTPYADFPQLAQMSAFEWAQNAVFDAPDAPAIGLQQLAAVPPQDWVGLVIRFTPALQRLNLDYNIPRLWVAVNAGDDALPDLEPSDYPQAWLLWREELNPHWRSLDVDEAWALDQAVAGVTFGELCEGICEWVDEHNAPMRAASFIKTWVNDGLVTALEV